jgi:hypothetical protein
VNATLAAEDHLRSIRALMERATIYRALSAPAAFTGGVLSVLCAALLVVLRANESAVFATGWFVVFAITVGVSAFLLWKDAQRRGQQFLSPAARSAALAMLPPLAAGGVLSIVAVLRDGAALSLPGTWLICYALALLAMGHFAPGSIRRLGWAFFAAALLVNTGVDEIIFDRVAPGTGLALRANLTMAATFGLLHLVYAGCTWSREAEPGATAVTP